MSYPKPYKRPFKGGHKKGMNLTEERYAEILELKKRAGEIKDYYFEKQKFKLADNTWYLPDFKVIFPCHIEFHEIKGGYITDKGKIKFKVAADNFPEYRWLLVQYKNKKTGFQIIKEV